MNLVPVRPPGPNARKARAFSSEILQLRTQGYTFEAIREALAAAGVHVSNSTVQREAIKAAGHPGSIPPADDAGSRRRTLQQPFTPEISVHAALLASCSAYEAPADQRDGRATTSAAGCIGKEGAEAFFNAHPSNPLFPAKDLS